MSNSLVRRVSLWSGIPGIPVIGGATEGADMEVKVVIIVFEAAFEQLWSRASRHTR